MTPILATQVCAYLLRFIIIWSLSNSMFEASMSITKGVPVIRTHETAEKVYQVDRLNFQTQAPKNSFSTAISRMETHKRHTCISPSLL